MTTVIAARNLSRRYSRGIVHGEKAIAAQSKQNPDGPSPALAYDRKPGGRDDAGNHEGQHALGEKHAMSPSCYAKGGRRQEVPERPSNGPYSVQKDSGLT